MKKEILVEVGEWARRRVDSGEEPPWTYHKLKQLAELVQEFAEGIEAGAVFAPGLQDDANLKPRVLPENVVKFERPVIAEPMPPLPA